MRNHPHQPLHRERVVSDLSHTLPLVQVGHDPRFPEEQALAHQNLDPGRRGRLPHDGRAVRSETALNTSAGTKVLPLVVGSVHLHGL